jgi:hypothetical protein
MQGIMDARHEGQQVAATAGVRNRPGQPGTCPSKRILGTGEPGSPCPSAGAIASVRCGKVYLAGIGKRLGRKALAEVAQVAKPDTILAWYQRLIASKIRWLQAPPLSRTAPDRIAERSPSRPNGPGEFRLGGMTGLSAHFPTWVTGCRTRRLPTFSAGMGLSRHANGIKTRPGRSSSSPTSRFWPESTSSQSLCSLGVA